MYIIDELIKIIEIFKKKNNIEKIKEIKNLLRENASIIQKYSGNIKDSFKLSEELINNFEALYNLIKDEKKDKDYYDCLRYIFSKEIQKVSDINYRYTIFEKLIEEDEMIKKSNDIFQLLLESCLKSDKFAEIRNNILGGEDQVLKLIEKELNKNKFVLSEALLYFFEKTALIYLKNILGSKDENNKIICLDDEPLNSLKECIQLLNFYMFKPKNLESKLKELGKLFCLAYIKIFSYTFIKMFDDSKPKFNDPKKIIDVLNGNNSIYKMIRLFIYKVLYNNYKIDVFINPESIKTYHLKDYKDFSELIENNKELSNIYKLDGTVKTINNDFYENGKKAIEKCQKDGFKNKIKTKDFEIEDTGVDNFYIVSYNFTLSNLLMDNVEMNEDFYNNICKPLFKDGDNLLFKAIQLFYEPTKYKKIKDDYKLNSDNLKPLLFGYRFCLNELLLKNKRGIYYPLYEGNINFLKEKLYPGNDTKSNEIFSNIINHFRLKPDEGCFVCLCENGYYHSVPSGFPGKGELDMKCPKCSAPIGSKKDQNEIKGVKRDKYFRIFKDNEEIEKDRNKRSKLKEINYMTIEEFKKKYVVKSSEKEKGVFITDKNSFKKDDKIIRNLSQISYRLLNYILYSHLFFAKLITNKRDFDTYLPKQMNWIDTLNECWNILKNELLKENIDSIEKFMYYIFVDLFPKLNKERTIDEYENLIKFEDILESEIQKKMKQYKEEKDNIKDDEDKTSFINLLKEKYIKGYYETKDFPFYEYFYYSDYLNEDYLQEKLNHLNENKYPVLEKYLEYNKNKKNEKKKKYSLDNLNTFNSSLNLINEEYFNNISREIAEKKKLIDDPIYINNKELIDKFIDFYNNLKIKDDKGNVNVLSNDKSLSNFFLNNDNDIGRSYKEIFMNFIKEQNEKIEKLLDMKIEKGVFDSNCKTKISIQKINENEIFNFNLPTKKSLIDILFDASYRKILDSDTRSYELYNEYEINYDLIEEKMTDLFLNNKKLLNDDITYFIYNNETFSHQINDLTSLFNKRYKMKNLLLDDKVVIYKFSDDNKNNTNICKNMINDFITLITLLNNKRKEGEKKEDNIDEESKIYQILDNIKDQVSPYFGKLFEKNESLTIDKTSAIFDYYLKCIYDDAKTDLKKYQEDLDNKTKELINKYYQTEHIIKKKDLANAIRLFIILILLPEEDKENKIKANRNNLINYLKAPDLWTKDIYENDGFTKNLNELKSFEAQIKHSISLYELLGKDIDDNFFDDVKGKINEQQKKENPPIDTNVDDDPFANKHKDKSDTESNDGKPPDDDDDDEEDDPFKKKEESEDEDDD